MYNVRTDKCIYLLNDTLEHCVNEKIRLLKQWTNEETICQLRIVESDQSYLERIFKNKF